ncbi:hypothetical protein [Embleya scabrispora]|uniref:hypothetical protein n=1 Tax=Embleya scabrispora TaxID=159449 RepID=UPI0003A67925|nr:hypothetical protein [Embleya scabrispora]MYS85986.1 hypothetical protein [Streptomyces sp. SID5474]
MSRCVNAVWHRAAAPAVPTRAAHRTNTSGRNPSSPRTRLTRRLFIDLRRSAGSLCR